MHQATIDEGTTNTLKIGGTAATVAAAARRAKAVRRRAVIRDVIKTDAVSLDRSQPGRGPAGASTWSRWPGTRSSPSTCPQVPPLERGSARPRHLPGQDPGNGRLSLSPSD